MPSVSSWSGSLRDAEPELLLRYDSFVRRLANDLLDDPDTAEDVAQEAWQAVLSRPPHSQFALANWLRRVIARLAVNRRRAERRRRARELAAARPEAVPSDQEIWHRENARRAAVTALLALPEPYRATLVLRYLEDLSPAAVAKRLQLPVETVQTRCKRGVQMIRQHLDATSARGHWRGALLALPALRLGPMAKLGAVLIPLSVILVTTQAKLKVLTAALLLLLGGLAWWQLGDHDRHSDTTASRPLEPGTVGNQVTAPSSTASAPGRALVEQPKPTQKASLGELRVRARTASGEPATGLAVTVRLLDAPLPSLERVFLRTDASGLAVVRVAAGSVEVAPSLGMNLKTVRAKVVAGATTDCDLNELDTCAVVRGQVVDSQGRGIAGATLLGADWAGGEAVVVGESGADGRFELQHCAHNNWVGARHDDYAPSAMRSFAGPVGSELTMLIELTTECASLRGTVLDPQGQPVGGAFVRLGHDSLFVDVPLPDGGNGKAPAPVMTRSDADGNFSFRGLPVGVAPLFVRSLGLARFVTDVTLEPRRPSEIIVRLEPSATIEGRATLPDGEPAAAASISAEPGRGPAFGSVAAETDADGRFTLRDLPPGKLRLHATVTGLATVEHELDLIAGALARWDVRFASTPPIVGQVVDSEGRGVADAIVACYVGTRGAHTRTDAQGNFVVTGLVHGRGSIDVRMSGTAAEALSLQGVKFDANPLLLRLPPGSTDLVTVRGRALDRAGKPQAGVEIGVGLANSGNSLITHTDAEGRFALGKFPHGEVRISMEAARCARVLIRRIPAPGESALDIGDVILEPAASLRIRLTMADGSPVPPPQERNGHRTSPVQATIYREDDTSVSRMEPLPNGELLQSDLPAGRYRVMLRPDSRIDTPIACTVVEVEVAAEQERVYTCALPSGQRCQIRARPPASQQLQSAEVRTASGKLVARVWLNSKGERVEGKTVLVPGSYRATWGATTKEFTVGNTPVEVVFD